MAACSSERNADGATGSNAPGVGLVRLAPGVPHLQKDPRAFRMDGIDHAFPALDLSARVNARRVDVCNATRRDCGCIGNQQAAFGGALRVVLDHEIAWNVAFLCTHPCERREHDAVVGFERSDVGMAE
jgi:hypothetical protein